MPYRDNSCWYSGGRHHYTGKIRNIMLWSAQDFSSGYWVHELCSLPSTYGNSGHIWRTKIGESCRESPEQARLVFQIRDSHILQPHVDSGDRGHLYMAELSWCKLSPEDDNKTGSPHWQHNGLKESWAGGCLCSFAQLCYSRHGREKWRCWVLEKWGIRGIEKRKRKKKKQHTPKAQFGVCFIFLLEWSCGSASTLRSMAYSCNTVVKSGPCSGQRQNIQSSPCWVLILGQTIELPTGTNR